MGFNFIVSLSTSAILDKGYRLLLSYILLSCISIVFVGAGTIASADNMCFREQNRALDH